MNRHASIAYDSAAGRWETGWKIGEDGSLTLTLSVPEGAEAHVILPYDPQRRRVNAGPGEHQWHWQPDRDLLHPFSLESLIMDLMDNEKTAALLREKTPALYSRCEGKKNEFRVLKPLEAAHHAQEDPEAVRALDPLLRRTEI